MVFLAEKETAVKKKGEKEKAVKKKTKHVKHTQMGFELLTSRVTIQHVSHSEVFVHYLQVLTSI